MATDRDIILGAQALAQAIGAAKQRGAVRENLEFQREQQRKKEDIQKKQLNDRQNFFDMVDSENRLIDDMVNKGHNMKEVFNATEDLQFKIANQGSALGLSSRQLNTLIKEVGDLSPTDSKQAMQLYQKTGNKEYLDYSRDLIKLERQEKMNTKVADAETDQAIFAAGMGKDARKLQILAAQTNIMGLDKEKGIIHTLKDKDAAQKAKVTFDDLVSKTNHLKKLISNEGVQYTGVKGSRQASAYANWIIAYKEAAKLGALTSSDDRIINAIVKDPQGAWNNVKDLFGLSLDNHIMAQLNQTMISARDSHGKALSNYGYKMSPKTRTRYQGIFSDPNKEEVGGPIDMGGFLRLRKNNQNKQRKEIESSESGFLNRWLKSMGIGR